MLWKPFPLLIIGLCDRNPPQLLGMWNFDVFFVFNPEKGQAGGLFRRRMLMCLSECRKTARDLKIVNMHYSFHTSLELVLGKGMVASLQWRHNGLDGASNYQPHHCLLSHLFGRRSKKTSKFRVTGLYAGNSPGAGEFPAQMASNAENVSIDDVIMLVRLNISLGCRKVKLNSSSPEQNGRRFADDIFACIFKNEKSCTLIRISPKFVPKGPIDNNPALV